MDFLLFLLPAFVLVIVFGYFKYINLLHEKSRQQKEIKQLYKLLNGFDFTIKQFGDTYQMKFQRLVKLNEATGNSSLTPIKPLVNNFSRIMAESIKSQGDTTVIIKKTYERLEPGSYDSLLRYINDHSKKAKQAWRSKGLMAVIDTLECILKADGTYSADSFEDELIAQ